VSLLTPSYEVDSYRTHKEGEIIAAKNEKEG
jgi:hypothetical protein